MKPLYHRRSQCSLQLFGDDFDAGLGNVTQGAPRGGGAGDPHGGGAAVLLVVQLCGCRPAEEGGDPLGGGAQPPPARQDAQERRQPAHA
eukprot:1177168-Prorocentrum_minimum.AAC.2